ncbi:MAG: chaperonin Cpn10 [Candidatus Kaiserbacteria bacterium]|nr:chaperonin Cpn10 [Candidatus Kaiserbacteria bacterium]
MKKEIAKNKKVHMNIHPLGDRVVVKPEAAEDEKSPSGFIIPDTARKERPERGVVVAVGDGRRNDRGELVIMRVAVGDIVMFSKYGYDEAKIDNEEYYIVQESNILAIIK